MTAQGLTIRTGQEIAEAASAMGLAEIMSYAEMFFKSGLFSDTAQASQAAVKILAGQELGMGPFQAMQSIHIIKGKATLSAGAMATLIKGSRKYDYRIPEKTDALCRIEFYQLNFSTNQYELLGESAFSRDDAKRQGTQNMDKYPANMLFNRAMSNGAKWFCPDIFGGPVYTPEEMGATINGDTGEIITLPDAPTLRALPPAKEDQKTAKTGSASASPSITTRLRNAVRKVWEKAGRDLRMGPACAALNVECESDSSEAIDLETFNDAGLVRMLHYAIHGSTLAAGSEPPTSEAILAEAKAFLS
jgi:hypothetical protein